MYLIVTKQRADLKVMETAILPAFIKGMEPTTIKHNGKKYPGTKIYTATGFFKAFVNPTQLAVASALVVKSGEVVKLTPAVPEIIAATKEVETLPVIASKILPLPKSLSSGV
jgi:hypothetical protein